LNEVYFCRLSELVRTIVNAQNTKTQYGVALIRIQNSILLGAHFIKASHKQHKQYFYMMASFILIVLLIFASNKLAGSELTDKAVELKLQHLEERIHSLEQPGN
jgi:hypothetical protein